MGQKSGLLRKMQAGHCGAPLTHGAAGSCVHFHWSRICAARSVPLPASCRAHRAAGAGLSSSPLAQLSPPTSLPHICPSSGPGSGWWPPSGSQQHSQVFAVEQCTRSRVWPVTSVTRKALEVTDYSGPSQPRAWQLPGECKAIWPASSCVWGMTATHISCFWVPTSGLNLPPRGSWLSS